ncbi:KamA family radical SAM protein [Youxingia wuxianensis]|uniref:KamA family radical SAM protein n=1 Tax=Youxingia wuxianensis TaxID=2763678 RepID=A0A926ER43_9FIRM|nr:KamA family radical SAM protein [Youxingia wuxianensis]MBC8585112.1 KamA family radical SAM protein [Youxingia wuxianensis]
MSWNVHLLENVTEAKQLQQLIKMRPEEVSKMEEILKRYPMSIPQYYLSLIDFQDPEDPIRKMCIPSVQETDIGGTFDTSGESDNTVITGMQHKYSQTAMVLSTSQCAMYCRHCFRKRLVGLSDQEIATYFEKILEYIKNHKEINNVLISGGDAFLNDNATIKKYLDALCPIDHLDFIRFGTRSPVVLPARIYDDFELLSILKDACTQKQIYVVTQFNHPKELTPQSLKAIKCLQEIGIVIKNQTVLLKGINDDPSVLGNLLKGLTQCGVVPYYIFQCRPVTGVKGQFQVPLEKGYEIIEAAKNRQNGQGKCVKYAMSHKTGKIEILGRLPDNRMLFKYHQAKKVKNNSRIFILPLKEGQCWLDDDFDKNKKIC